jgi:hypothetical protein
MGKDHQEARHQGQLSCELTAHDGLWTACAIAVLALGYRINAALFAFVLMLSSLESLLKRRHIAFFRCYKTERRRAGIG